MITDVCASGTRTLRGTWSMGSSATATDPLTGRSVVCPTKEFVWRTMSRARLRYPFLGGVLLPDRATLTQPLSHTGSLDMGFRAARAGPTISARADDR
jgi:hypothetical protein